MNYYYRHLGDYAKNCGHLTMLEHGAYTLLLDRYYSTEKPIPASSAYRICVAKTKAERRAVDNVLRDFFQRREKTWIKRRCDQEIAHLHEKREKARQSGYASGAARREKRTNAERTLNERSTDLELSNLQSPISNLKNKNSEGTKVPRGPELKAGVAAIVASHRVPK